MGALARAPCAHRDRDCSLRLMLHEYEAAARLGLCGGAVARRRRRWYPHACGVAARDGAEHAMVDAGEPFQCSSSVARVCWSDHLSRPLVVRASQSAPLTAHDDLCFGLFQGDGCSGR